MKKLLNYFTTTEKILWIVSVVAIVISFYIFNRVNFVTLVTSLVCVTALIFNAKGNPFGQVLTIVFSILYAYISFTFDYYGEMITYLCMTTPMAIVALVSWVRNPYEGNKSEVKINKIRGKEYILMAILTAVVTFAFYFILKAFNTANIVPSTISIATSFVAVYLTFRRSHFFAIGYAANDIILIILWTLASLKDPSYISVVVCFVTCFANDVYGFINWGRMHRRQNSGA